ncbi:MAG: hypothetical protein B6I24_00655 [Bacteroidetes bacterium 4572_128]|nr:MAG: hypothetical protein B6I24_00655 [Bacteroidetes bacterium 4572_128]
MKTVISIENLSIAYKLKKRIKTIKKNINLIANEGELIALIGANGVGKSTFLRTISSLQKHFFGEIKIFNKEINKYSNIEMSKKLSFVSTEIINVNNLKVKDLVALGRFPYTNFIGKLKEKDKFKISSALEITGMKNFANKYINEISDGERQKVMIAKTLAQDTDIIILDEPSAFLDLENKYEIISILKKLSEENNKTIIFSSHDLNITMQEADKICFHNKKIIFDNKKFDFIRKNNNKNFKINLISDENLEKFLTKKALERINFKITENSKMKIFIKKDLKKTIWIFKIQNEKKICYSIYELIFILKKIKKILIKK